MGGQWNEPLCDPCFPCKHPCRACIPCCWTDNECLVYLAPHIAFANIADKSGTMSWMGALMSMTVPGWNVRLAGRTRQTIRENHGIDGARWKDDCAIACCPACALMQMQNQVDPNAANMGESIERQ